MHGFCFEIKLICFWHRITIIQIEHSFWVTLRQKPKVVMRMQSWIKIEWEHIVNEKSINLEKTTSSVLSVLLLVFGCRINQIALHVIYPASMELNHILSSPAFPARTASACRIFNSASLSPFSPFRDMVGIEKKFFIQYWLFSKL